VYSFLAGVIGGIVATALMTLTEIPSWKKWGLHGVFEWHENQVLSEKFFRISEKIDFRGIFVFHFGNGALAGLAFPFIITLLDTLFVTVIDTFLVAIIYGFVLWIVTLVPIHKPITGYPIWNHPLGHSPALASLGGHIVYGLFLGLVMIALTGG
jgi:uncharacterized membrane protein